MSYTLFLIVITDINIMVAASTRVAQVEDPMSSIGTENSAVQISAGEPRVVELVAAPVAVEATTTTVMEVLATALELKEPVVDLVPAQVESAPVSVGVTRPVMERGSGMHWQGHLQLPTSWKNWRIKWCNNFSLP